ncbi:trypsin-like serine protease [Halosquirtibacter laminarini]|uniref:Trypsin-like serine protease n=1 Tax=Halosquirtibacter laminarini TaxID=3374600 RepID=A0AC61NJ23_9BACT|nr:trypsin-like serine protease [Prolixibacteraceae bacterium]
MKKVYFLLVFMISVFFLYGNNMADNTPKPYTKYKMVLNRSNQQVFTVTLPLFNNHDLREMFPVEKSKRLQIAFPYSLNLNFIRKATKIDYEDKSCAYLMKIASKDALFLSMQFSKMQINSGMHLFVYGNKTNTFHPVQNGMENSMGGFQSCLYKGDTLFVELDVPSDLGVETCHIQLGSVKHGFRNLAEFDDNAFQEKQFKVSGSCQVDINCTDNEEYQLLKRSVCRLLISGEYVCTGTLINSKGGEKPPYVLTANHCISSDATARNTYYHFNYESYRCSGFDGPHYDLVYGGTVKATAEDLDFCLVEMNTKLSPSNNAYYAGWDATGMFTPDVVGIHHPSGDVKKYSISHEAPTFGNYGQGIVANSSVHIKKWNLGTTEGGSSGSALFDDKKIIGSLIGGVSKCGNPYDDYYSSLYYTFDHYNERSKQLKYWLVGNEDIRKMEGYDPNKDSDNMYELNLNVSREGNAKSDINESISISAICERFTYDQDVMIEKISVTMYIKANYEGYKEDNVVFRVYNMSDINAGTLTPIAQYSLSAEKLTFNKLEIIGLASPLKVSKDHIISVSLEGKSWRQDYIPYFSDNITNTAYYVSNGVMIPMNSYPMSRSGAFFIGELVSYNKGSSSVRVNSDNNEVRVFSLGKSSSGKYCVRSSKNLGDVDFKVYDILGNKILTQNLSISIGDNHLTIQVSRHGVYFYSIEKNGVHYKGKFISY